MSAPVHVIGAGLAGSEAAWQLAQAGTPVVLHEMRPLVGTAAHQTGGFAELVCSNSFRSDDWAHNAVGLLHAEMRACGSLILECADTSQVPAGGALAVDREGFSAASHRADACESTRHCRGDRACARPETLPGLDSVGDRRHRPPHLVLGPGAGGNAGGLAGREQP